MLTPPSPPRRSTFSTTPSSSSSSYSSSSSSSSYSLTTTKLKTLLHNLILSRISRFYSKLKSAIARALEEIDLSHYFTSSSSDPLRITTTTTSSTNSNYKSRMKKKILYGSFRLHYNWCSSSSNAHHQALPPLNYTAPGPDITSAITSHLMDEFGKSSRPSRRNNSWGGGGSSRRICRDYSSIDGRSNLSSSFVGSSIDYRSCDESFRIDNGSNSNTTDDKSCCKSDGNEDDGVVFGEQQLSKYLQWLENQKKSSSSTSSSTGSSTTCGCQASGEGGPGQQQQPQQQLQQEDYKDEHVLKMMNQIDKLADMFIADCHEKFRLEKVESYRSKQASSSSSRLAT